MRFLDLTLSDPASNLALDEALLNEAEDRTEPTELLRLWESPEHMIVIGRGSKATQEVRLDECRRAAVPVLRRCSGGTSVVAGPGCLMYALVLNYDLLPELRSVEYAHNYVMRGMRAALSVLDPRVQHQGSCDLTIEHRKISGNSLRCKRRHLLYHGTVLYDFPLEKMESWLGTPPREPSYRAGRKHSEFLTNLPQPVNRIREAIRAAWDAQATSADWPRAATERLVAEQYSRESWNFRI